MSLSFGSIYQPLKLALLPESHVIRHLALEVLLTTGPPTSVLEAILKQCLKIEDTPLLVKNARIRQMHIRKLATMAQANGETASSTEVIDTTQQILIGKCIHRTYQILLFFLGLPFLILPICCTAQLKVHFQPLWEESLQALTDLNA